VFLGQPPLTECLSIRYGKEGRGGKCRTVFMFKKIVGEYRFVEIGVGA